MAIDLNGPEVSSPEKPTAPGAVITVTIRATMTPKGSAISVDVDPAGVYADAVVDICTRVARSYDRLVQSQLVISQLRESDSQAPAVLEAARHAVKNWKARR